MNAIEIQNLTKTYKLYERNVADRFKDTFLPGKKKRHKEFHALKDINLTVKKGEILGLIGRNGAGKSTLLKIIAGITQPTFGSVKVHGRVVALLELGAGFNPEYTGKENIYFTCALQGMTKEEVDKIYSEIVDFAELGEFIDVPVKKYSSGMKARLGFAISIRVKPDILILDEILAVGDEYFRNKCLFEIRRMFESGITVLYVSHSLKSIESLCDQTLMIEKGELVIKSITNFVCNEYWKICQSKVIDDNRIDELKIMNKDEKIKKEFIEELKRDNEKKEKDFIKKIENRIIKNKMENDVVKEIQFAIMDTNYKKNESYSMVWKENYIIKVFFEVKKETKISNINLTILTSIGEYITNEKVELNNNCLNNREYSLSFNFYNFLKNGYYSFKISIFSEDNSLVPIYKNDEESIFKVINSGDEIGNIKLIDKR